MTATLPEVDPDTTRSDYEGLHHVFLCHDEDTAYCGLDLTGIPVGECADDADICIVCGDLSQVACGCSCGCCWGLTR